jgi:hypothetical protein
MISRAGLLRQMRPPAEPYLGAMGRRAFRLTSGPSRSTLESRNRGYLGNLMRQETAISLYRRSYRIGVRILAMHHRARRARQNGMRPIASPP